MRWIDTRTAPVVAPPAKAALLRQAIAKFPRRAGLQRELGEALALCGQHADAVQAYEAARRLEPQAFSAWADLAKSHLKSGDAGAALAALAGREGPAIDLLRGRALRKLGRADDAKTAFHAALAREDADSLAALQELLEPLVLQPDGAGMLAFCDSLPWSLARTATARGYRAIALSRTGRTDDARHLVDVERHVARYRFTPPAGLGDLAAFNHALAQEILADPSPDTPLRDGIDINYFPRTNQSRYFVALHDFFKASMAEYVAALPRMGLDTVLPPLPQTSAYATGNVVLRDDGKNGEHIHGRGYISAVYHVLVPDAVAQADDTRGSLALGCCETITGGYTPCWGKRYIKPQAGWLTVIPSHMFHDVVPPRTAAPRVSVVADLRPVWDAHDALD